MKTNSISSFNNTSFGAIPLYNAVLTKKILLRRTAPIKAFVGFIEKTDLENAGMAYKRWAHSAFGPDIFDQLQSKYANYDHFLLVKAPDEKESRQIRALAFFKLEQDYLELVRFQSKSRYSNIRGIKGAGSLVLYALSKIADMCGKDKIIVYSSSSAEAFYEKMGFERKGIVRFELLKKDFAKFQQKLEKKLQISKAK